jgi:hypothetical protein
MVESATTSVAFRRVTHNREIIIRRLDSLPNIKAQHKRAKVMIIAYIPEATKATMRRSRNAQLIFEMGGSMKSTATKGSSKFLCPTDDSLDAMELSCSPLMKPAQLTSFVLSDYVKLKCWETNEKCAHNGSISNGGMDVSDDAKSYPKCNKPKSTILSILQDK